jgi:hypothetical protein
MISPSGYRRTWVLVLSLFVGAVIPVKVLAQHGAHSATATHMSAPPPRIAAPRPAMRAPTVVAPHAASTGVNPDVGRPMPPRTFVPAGAGFASTPPRAGAGGGSTAILRNITIGFPRSPISSGVQPGSARIGSHATVFGDGHTFWTDRGASRGGVAGVWQSGVRRRTGPVPRRPVFFPIFYPSFYPGVWGFGWNAGFGGCDPFWEWNGGCGYGYGDYLLGGSGFGYFGPSEPYYEPVPSDNNTSNEEDEAVVYLKDGTVYLISDYWLADNQLHYLSSDGAEHVIDMDQVDLQKTVDVNAKRGVDFTLRPRPANAAGGGQGATSSLPSPQQ